VTVRTPAYRLLKPSGQAVDRLSGRDLYLGKHGTPASRAEYDRLVSEWLACGRQFPRRSSVGSPADLPVCELIVAYLNHADAYCMKKGKRTSETANIRLAMRPLREAFSHTAAREFGPLALKSVRQKFVSAGLCRREVNKRTRHIVRLFKWAASEEMISLELP
jgi:hypothetical protein